MFTLHPSKPIIVNTATIVSFFLWISLSQAQDFSYSNNPISKIARVIDPKLVHAEDRLSWLNERIVTLAERREHSMKHGIGYRGHRPSPQEPDPQVLLDLQLSYPIDEIYLIPSQKESINDKGIFPKRFTIELSERADFSEKTIIYSSSNAQVLEIPDSPIVFRAHGNARFVRLIVHQGHPLGAIDLFGLAEIAVISNNQAVSFNAQISTVGALNTPGVWYPEALIDGRSQFGLWQNQRRLKSSVQGDKVDTKDQHQVTWTLNLDETIQADRVVLFPYQLGASFESAIMPDALKIICWDENGARKVHTWSNTLSGSNTLTPTMISLSGAKTRTLQIISERAYQIGGRNLHSLSEIQLWADNTNVALGKPIIRQHGNHAKSVNELTDDYTSERHIIGFGHWLSQLTERTSAEAEIALLVPLQNHLASESELNAAWLSSVALGLTFLIPVFMFERRRIAHRQQIDRLRNRIACDLHDDIGSNLGSISLIARSARKDLERLKGPEEVVDDLGEVESIARESSLAMRDIVWLVERRQDSIGDLVERMKETAERLLREMHVTMDCEMHKTSTKLSLDAKRHLFLFYKEVIHNVLKHSKAKKVSIRMWDVDDSIALQIEDDGIGLTEAQLSTPESMRKLHDRARVLEGKLRVESEKGHGTNILLYVKRSQLNAQPSTS